MAQLGTCVRPTLVGPEPQKQRADAVAALVDPVARHDAVGGALVLHLELHPLVADVEAVGGLGHDPVEAGALEALEPVLGLGAVRGGAGEVDGGGGAGEGLFQLGPTAEEGLAGEVLVAEGQQVEGHEAGRRLRRQAVDAGLGGVDALLELVELEALGADQHDLAVDHAAVGQLGQQRRQQLGEVAGEGALVAAAQLDLVAVLEHDAAEAVPLGLEGVVPVGQLVDAGHRLGEHRLHGRVEREGHRGRSVGNGWGGRGERR